MSHITCFHCHQEIDTSPYHLLSPSEISNLETDQESLAELEEALAISQRAAEIVAQGFGRRACPYDKNSVDCDIGTDTMLNVMDGCSLCWLAAAYALAEDEIEEGKS